MQQQQNKWTHFAWILSFGLLSASGEAMVRTTYTRHAHAQVVLTQKISTECSERNVCLDVVRLGDKPISGSRWIVVTWLPMSNRPNIEGKLDEQDEQASPMPSIGYVARFAEEQKTLQIPLDHVAMPDNAHAQCQPCDVGAVCACTDQEKKGLAYITLVNDPDDNGILEENELIDADVEGLASVVVAFGKVSLDDSPSQAQVADSVRVFRWVTSYEHTQNVESLDYLEIHSASTHAALYTCALGDAHCALKFPDLM